MVNFRKGSVETFMLVPIMQFTFITPQCIIRSAFKQLDLRYINTLSRVNDFTVASIAVVIQTPHVMAQNAQARVNPTIPTERETSARPS